MQGADPFGCCRTFGQKLREYEDGQEKTMQEHHKSAFTVTVSPEKAHAGFEHSQSLSSNPSLFYLEKFRWKESSTETQEGEEQRLRNTIRHGDATETQPDTEQEPDILERIVDTSKADNDILYMVAPHLSAARPVMHVRYCACVDST